MSQHAFAPDAWAASIAAGANPALRACVPPSMVSGIRWPGIPDNLTSLSLAMQFQLDASQWWPIDALRRHQLDQVSSLAAYAFLYMPFWRERLTRAGYDGREMTQESFSKLPILTRSEVRAAGDAAYSAAVPADHGAVGSGRTSGSTGMPLETRTTEAAQLVWHSITVRDSLWHGRDLSGKFASIRVGQDRGTSPTWGRLTFRAFQTGPTVELDARDDVETQIEWLLAERPNYLLSHASNLRVLASRFIERGLRLDSLREVVSYSEALPADLRALVKQAWGVKLVDLYSTSEAGYLALQCPLFDHYHVQAESVLLEIVDERGEPCEPGSIGRVVATPLHNFAMPLLRYEVGDYAEVGAPCPCGRGLPVITRIMGRGRNMMRLPDGGTCWPGVPMNALVALAPLRQFRLVQHSPTGIEMQMVLDRPLSGDEETTLRRALQARLRYPFDIRFTRVERFETGPGHKFEDFVCQVT